MKIIVLRMSLLFSVILLVAITFVLADEKGKTRSSSTGGGYPKIAEMMSENKIVRSKSIWQYVSTQDELAQQLAQVVHTDTGKKIDKQLRGSACFLLAQIRTTNHRAIEALVKAIDEDFLPPLMVDIPYGILNPPGALLAIGKPAVTPVLDELAITKDKEKDKITLSHTVILGIEGVDCALIRVQTHIDKEADPKKKARLKMTLKYFEDKKAKVRKK